jgi:hypothetical protein
VEVGEFVPQALPDRASGGQRSGCVGCLLDRCAEDAEGGVALELVDEAAVCVRLLCQVNPSGSATTT